MNIHSLWQKKVDQTKIERIRNASVEVISEHGILGGSVASIAERADVSVGYLYRHYPGKTELINDLLENALNAITDRIHALIRETDDIERIVGGIVGFLIESAADNPAKHKFLIMLLNDFSVEIKPESRKRIIEIGEVLLETGQKTIRSGAIFRSMICILRWSESPCSTSPRGTGSTSTADRATRRS